MNLCIVFVRANYLRRRNESNDKERRKKARKGKINSIYISDKQCYLKFDLLALSQDQRVIIKTTT